MLHVSLWQRIVIVSVLAAGLLYVFPNFLSPEARLDLPDWMPREGLRLGLDLQGGSYLLAEVQLAEVFREQLENLTDSLRLEFQQERIDYHALEVGEDRVSFEVPELQRDEVLQIVGRVAPDFGVETSTSGDTEDFLLIFGEEAKEERSQVILQQSLEVIRRRLDETGTQDPSIQRHGTDRILVQLPGVKDPERIKRRLNATAKLTFRLVDERALERRGGILPAGVMEVPSNDIGSDGEPILYPVERRIMVSGENLIDAQASFSDGAPVVSFRFDTLGAKRFGHATQQNVGRVFAAILDGRVISAPRIEEPILGGSGIIRGGFTVEETRDLALLLRAGALPAPLVYLEERSVGPGLGSDSIAAGKVACLSALVLVFLFMWLMYGFLGGIATLALLFNMVLVFGGLSLLQATLTLPGIAGIVLTLGMAVDANILIFERVREEIDVGRGVVRAVDVGYRRALTTILDSNITTLIAALLLFQFGSGPIKGFAVTLALGICTSMFTAILSTRWTISAWLRWRRPQALSLAG